MASVSTQRSPQHILHGTSSAATRPQAMRLQQHIPTTENHLPLARFNRELERNPRLNTSTNAEIPCLNYANEAQNAASLDSGARFDAAWINAGRRVQCSSTQCDLS